MKRLIICLMLSLFSVFGIAQNNSTDLNTWDDIIFLDGVHKARFVLDLSNALIDGIEASDFKEMDPNWDDGVKEMTMRFMSAFNNISANGINPLRIGVNTESDITLYLIVHKATDDGSHVYAQFEARNQEGQCLFSRSVEAEQGHRGTRLNLMGDALEKMGKQIALKITSILSKESKEIEEDAPDINDADIRPCLKRLMLGRESIAIHITVSERCASQLLGNKYITTFNDGIVYEMGQQFRDSFVKAFVKSSKNIYPMEKIFLGETNPDGATMHIEFAWLYGRMEGGFHNTFIVSRVHITDKDGKQVSGVIETGVITTSRNFVAEQMTALGKKLGKVK